MLSYTLFHVRIFGLQLIWNKLFRMDNPLGSTPIKPPDLIDQIITAQRQADRLRKTMYREHLQKQIEHHTRQKEHEKFENRSELVTIQANIKKAEEMEECRKRERMKIQQEFREANKEILELRGKREQSEPAEPQGKGIYERLNEGEQGIRNKRREKMQLQNQMNYMQEQIKKEDQIRSRNQQYKKEHVHIQQYEQYLEKREKQKQNMVTKYKQNMKVYDQFSKIKENQTQKINEMMRKIQNSGGGDFKQEGTRRFEEYMKKEKEIAWKNDVKNQIEQKKKLQDKRQEEKKRQRQLIDQIDNGPPAKPLKDKQYLKLLEVQIQQQKQRKVTEKNQRLDSPKGQASWFSPAFIGQIPVSIERYKQLQYVDRKMGLLKPSNPITLTQTIPFSTQNSPKPSPRQTVQQIRSYNQLKNRLMTTRQINSGSKENLNPFNGKSSEMLSQGRATTHVKLDERHSNISYLKTEVPNSPTVKSLKMYNFITGSNRVYNFASPPQ